jgi:hypothetical protein
MRHKGLNKVQDPYTIQDSYPDYLEKYPEGSVYYLTYSEYRDIVVAYFRHIANQVVHKSKTVTLPFRLGEISVEKHKPAYKSLRNMPIDWDRSTELNKQVRQFNEHSNGFAYRFHWNRSRCQVGFKTVYIFQASRFNKREVARLIKTRQNDYFQKS